MRGQNLRHCYDDVIAPRSRDRLAPVVDAGCHGDAAGDRKFVVSWCSDRGERRQLAYGLPATSQRYDPADRRRQTSDPRHGYETLFIYFIY